MRPTPTYTIAGLHNVFRALPKDMSAGLRDASQEIAKDVASQAQARGAGVSKLYARYVAPTIKASRDRVPVVKMGGTKRIRKGDRQSVGDVIWGAEFGGRGRSTTMQFLPHLGTTGYALWPTVRELQPDIGERYSDALLGILEDI